MTPLATRQQPRYTTATSGKGAYGYVLETQTPLLQGVRSNSQLVRDVAVTGNKSNVAGLSHRCAFDLLLASKITKILLLGKHQIAQLAPTCVKIVLTCKNKWSKSSLAEGAKRVYNMIVTKSINEKSAQRLEHAGTLITQRPIQEDRMSLFLAIIPQSHVRDYWKPARIWGFTS